MSIACPQCAEPIGWERRVPHTYRRTGWTCPRCAAELVLRRPGWSTGVVAVPAAGLIVSFLPALLPGSVRRWLLAVCVSLLFTAWVLGMFWVRPVVLRPGFGFCQQCGYNLRGLAGNRCPECGGDVEAQKA